MEKLEIEKLLQTKHSLNSDQREAVSCFDNCVVKAGAGAGKTTVLSYRFLNLILQNKANCDEILTLTFTKKAAAEMYERIYKQLLLLKDKSKIIERQFALFNKATISTIDSFCNQIVKQDCIRYGIPSDFTIDNAKAADITKRCAQQLIENDDMLDGFKFLSKAYYPNDLIDNIIVKLAVSSFYFPLKFEKDKVYEDCYNLINNSISEYENSLLLILNNLSEIDAKDLSASMKKTLSYLKEYHDEIINYEFESPNFYKKLESLNFSTPRKSKKNPITEDIVEWCKTLKESAKDLQSLLFIKNNNYIVEVVEALEILKDNIFKEKRRLGVLTFSDISHLAVDILLTNKKLRNIYKEKFKYIMIDEFQDNNKLQKDLTYLLSEKKDLSLDVVPDVSSIESNKLFFVGDEKQSIYKFRDADVSVFKALSREIEESNGRVIDLKTNYRSEPNLIRYFNDTFLNVFSNSKKDFEANFEPLDYRSAKKGVNSKIELYIKTEDSDSLIDDEEEEASSAECEATKIAKIINNILNSDDYLLSDKNDKLRRPNVNDIAILLRTKTHQIEYEKALRAKKIPFIIQDNKAYPLEALTNDIYNILQLLIYPDDKLAYISVLKGPFGAISEKAIVSILDNYDPENLFVCEIELTLKDRIKLTEIEKTFNKLIELSKISDISSLLNYLWWEAGLRYYYVCEPNYHLYIDNFEYLYRLSKKYDLNQYPLSLFLDEMRGSLGSSSTNEEVPVLKESAKGVQIMTIHKSKGLEFPIVIVSNMGSAITQKEVNFSIEKNVPILKHCISIDKKTMKEKYDSVFINRAKELTKEKDIAEIKRVLYVALTRAETHLIMSATIRSSLDNEIIDNKEKSLLAMIYNASIMEDGSINPLLQIKDIEKVSVYENYVKVENKPIVERKQYLDNIKYYESIEPNYDTNPKNIGVTTYFGHNDDGNFEQGSPFALSKVDKLLEKLYENNSSVYTDFGTLCHIYVQSLIMEKPILSLLDESVLSKGSSLSKLNKENIKLIENEAIKYAKDFVSSSFYNHYVKNYKCSCEFGFFSKVENDNGEVLVFEGFIDLLVKYDNDNYLVVDFKTDKVRNPAIHEKQIQTYITAVKRLYPNSCVKGCVVYLREKDKEYFY
ncbi:MAG: UvrD-helicase domain-containing protein [Pleomorphochaeta sp.]